MSYWVRLAIISGVAITFCATCPALAQNAPPADNDDSYKLPLFMPKAAMPANSGKVVFNDSGDGDNDEIYSLPKRAAVRLESLKPAAGGDQGQTQAQQNYNEQYKQYQEQMRVYNEQMVEYRKQLEAQQKQQATAPGDNDTSYVLPGAYSQTKKNIKPPARIAAAPKPQSPAPKATQPAIQAQAPAQAQQPAPQYQPAPSVQYNQKYNYSDQYDRAPAAQQGQSNGNTSGTNYPSYYY